MKYILHTLIVTAILGITTIFFIISNNIGKQMQRLSETTEHLNELIANARFIIINQK